MCWQLSSNNIELLHVMLFCLMAEVLVTFENISEDWVRLGSFIFSEWPCDLICDCKEDSELGGTHKCKKCCI